MKKKQIVEFVQTILPNNFFRIKFASEEECEKGSAAVDENNVIYLNRKEFYRASDIQQRAIILHEIGHIFVARKLKPSDDEYKAHLIAMSLAKTLGLKREIRFLDSLIRSWDRFGWNEDNGTWRRHILACKKYKRTHGVKAWQN